MGFFQRSGESDPADPSPHSQNLLLPSGDSLGGILHCLDRAPTMCTSCHCVKAHVWGVFGPMMTHLSFPLQDQALRREQVSMFPWGERGEGREGCGRGGLCYSSQHLCVKDSLEGLPGLRASADPVTVLGTIRIIHCHVLQEWRVKS